MAGSSEADEWGSGSRDFVSELEPSRLDRLPCWRRVSDGADLTGLPSADACSAVTARELDARATARRRWKLSAVGDWNRRATISSNEVFSYALRI